MTGYIVAIVVAIALLAFMVELLRRRQLAEKYAALWLLVGLTVLVLLVVPGLLRWVAGGLGFDIPANLLFFLAVTFLVGVTVHLSWELSRAEDETRCLAEELTILRDRVDRLEAPADEPVRRTRPAADGPPTSMP